MNIDFNRVLLDLDDNALKDGDDDRTLAGVCVKALLVLDQADMKGVDGKERFVRGELARRIHKGGVIDLETNEIAKIKKLVGKAFFPMIVERAWKMLENKADELDKPTVSKVEKEQ